MSYLLTVYRKTFESSELVDIVLSTEPLSMKIGGKYIVVRTKILEVFSLLIQHQGKLVPRGFFYQQIWFHQHLTGRDGLSHTVHHLRKLLKKLAIQNIEIVTIPKSGYLLLISSKDSDAIANRIASHK